MRGTAEQGRTYRDTATGRLLLAYRQDGDVRARDRLVQLYLPLVDTLAQRYARADAEHEDLVQAGSIGLLNAIERYDPRRGDELAAFAVPTISGEIKRHLRDRTAMVKLPRRLQEAGASLPRVREQLTARLEREPTERELAAALELEPAELARLQEAQRSGPPPDDGPGTAADTDLDLSDDRLMLAGAFHVLDHEERSIVQLRYIDDLPAAEAATRLGLSERQLTRRTQAALAKLRAELEGGSPSTRERPAEGGPTAPAAKDPGSAAVRPAPAASEPASAAQDPGSAAVRPAAEQRPAPAASEPAPAAQAAQPAAADGTAKEKTSHSGRLLLRMPQSLHAELARAAEREETSLNQFITNSLAASVGWRQPTEAKGDDDHDPQPTSADAQPRWLRAALVTNIVVVALAAIVAIVLLVVAWQQGL